jgi:hypothetical protein
VGVSEHVYNQNFGGTYFLCIPRHHGPANLVSNLHPFICKKKPDLFAAVLAFALWAFSSLMSMRCQISLVLRAAGGLILLLRRHGTGPKPYEVEYIQLWNDLPHPVRQSVEKVGGKGKGAYAIEASSHLTWCSAFRFGMAFLALCNGQ